MGREADRVFERQRIGGGHSEVRHFKGPQLDGLAALSHLASHTSLVFIHRFIRPGQGQPRCWRNFSFSISALQAVGTPSRCGTYSSTSSFHGSTAGSLTARWQFYLHHSLPPATRRVYLSAQCRYLDFCRQDGRLGPNGALLPADEQTLMRFSALLADSLTHSSIKVYLSAVRSLHIDTGLLDPLVNCLQLQCLLRGIKQVQGSASRSRLPITIDLLKVIQQSLDMRDSDHVMLWAACCLGFFGFLQAGEFTVNSSFDPSVHLSIGDIQADSLVNPTCFKVRI